MSKPIVERLAEFIVQLDSESVPDEAIQIAKHRGVEGVAMVLAGSTVFSPSACTRTIMIADRGECA